MTERRATCQCGAYAVTCRGEPVRVGICHCLACQKRSGSAFAVQARFRVEDVAVTGEFKTWVRVGDEGGRIAHNFCPTCGSTVSYTIDRDPGLIAVAVGAFADPAFPPPQYIVYEARRHPWAALPNLEADRFE